MKGGAWHRPPDDSAAAAREEDGTHIDLPATFIVDRVGHCVRFHACIVGSL